jgi:hypothetical protein
MKILKEVPATTITAVGLLLALSVTQGWNWPLLADARAGIIALAVVGFGGCIASGQAAPSYSMRDPLVIVAFAAGAVLLVAGVAGLSINTVPYLVVMMIATVVLWLAATVRHVLAASRPATGGLSAA